MKFVYKKQFLKQITFYPAPTQKLILETDYQIKLYLEGQNVPYGLRIKKIGPNTFEARVNDKIRIVWVRKDDTIYFTLIGNHDEVRRFIKNI